MISCILVRLVPEKPSSTSGSAASQWAPSCTMGRCARLCQGTTCRSPPLSDAPCVERPTWTQHDQALDGSLWFMQSLSLSVKVPVCPLWPYTKTRVSCHSLCSGLKSSPVLSQVTPGCYPLPPRCAHADTHAHTHALWRTGINTITIVPISCPCCHYAAAEWDMVEFPSVKENQTCTHIHISWPNNSRHLSLSLSLFAWFRTLNAYLCVRSHTYTPLPELSGLIPPSYWCVSVSERGAAQRATMGLCVAPREQRAVYSMPAPRLFWKHCMRLFKLWPYFELSDCMSNKEQQRGCFSVKEHWPDWPPLALVMSS